LTLADWKGIWPLKTFASYLQQFFCGTDGGLEAKKNRLIKVCVEMAVNVAVVVMVVVLGQSMVS